MDFLIGMAIGAASFLVAGYATAGRNPDGSKALPTPAENVGYASLGVIAGIIGWSLLLIALG